ncbi:glucose-1-phosphate adenylyltransferase [bacterium]|nr:glucose-1-phosphate adenylyltransferase [bacterium]
MRDVMAVILGGGRGTRLYPLTKYRSKPAVPLAGTHRLIDIPISNCLNSDITRIFVLTQFNSASLNRHVSLAYHFDAFRREGFVNILAAEQTDENMQWFQGTADAMRQTLRHYRRFRFKHYLVLSGDHIYRMDYRKLIRAHEESDADVSVAALPVHRDKVPAFGVLSLDDKGWINEFVEKPSDPEVISKLEVGPEFFESQGKDPYEGYCVANMGIYVFDRDVLEEMLLGSSELDFGKEVFPRAVAENRRVHAHLFEGYWEDIGTIKAFYDANLDFVEIVPKFSFYDEYDPIYTHARFLPPSKITRVTADKVTFAQGCIVDDSYLRRSIIGIRSRVGRGSTIIDSVIMGADEYETPEVKANLAPGVPEIGIGHDCHIEGAILDKNARIGHGVRIVAGNGPEQQGDGWMLRDGIVVIEKDAVIPDGTQLIFR